jgi:hypothetical protein
LLDSPPGGTLSMMAGGLVLARVGQRRSPDELNTGQQIVQMLPAGHYLHLGGG